MIDVSGNVGRTFVELSDLLVDGIDKEVGQRNQLTALCVKMLDVRSAGLLSRNADGELTLIAASAESAELLTRYEETLDQGPGVDAFRTGERVECGDLAAADLRWPRFAPVAREAGMAAAYGLPCRLRDEVVGALTLYLDVVGPLSSADLELGRGLANTLSLGFGAHRGRALAVRAEQLQGALHSRVAIEQAKGALAERLNITVDDAFAILRTHARQTGRKMRDVADDVVNGKLTLPV